METHQTSDLRIAGSTPAMLVFLYSFFLCLAEIIVYSLYLSLNGNVAQSVERKSHNLKVVSSILTVPTFFAFLLCYDMTLLLSFSSCFFSIYCMGIWRNGNASDFGSEDCRFDPCYARLFASFLLPQYHSHAISFFSLNGNVAQSVERKSHNLKVVSSILTVPTFFAFLFCYVMT